MLKKTKPGRKRERPARSPEAARVGKEITAARDRRGLKIPDVGSILRISPQALSKIETGQSNPHDPRTLRTLARLAELLQSDFGMPALTEHATKREVEVPIVGRVAAGEPIDFTEPEGSVTVDASVIRIKGDVCALKVRGDSMINAHIMDRDVLICRRNYNPQNGRIVVVDLRSGAGATVKTWNRKEDQLLLAADSPTGETYAFSASMLGKVYEIVGLIRNYQ